MCKAIECPECREHSINFETGQCVNKDCGYSLSFVPVDIARQHNVDFSIRKLTPDDDDILIISPKNQLSTRDIDVLADMFEKATSAHIIILNDKTDFTTMTDVDLRAFGLKRLEEVDG